MALKAMALKKRIDEKRAILEQCRTDFKKFERREKEIERAIDAADTKEKQDRVDAEIDQFEQDKKDSGAVITNLENEINGLEEELAEAEKVARPQTNERKENKRMEVRTKSFFGMTRAQAEEFVTREDVKNFLTRAKEAMTEKRSITGGALLIPTVVLDIIRENLIEYSKLYKHVKTRYVSGNARQPVMGLDPEAVWTEMCGNLNELNINFGVVEVDGYKVGGFIPVCNSVIEDSDVDFAETIMVTLGHAIGKALDKAILFGTGTKMPLGIFTRLAQTEDPSDPHDTRTWVDLHTSNMLGVNGSTDIAKFKSLVTASGRAKGAYSRGRKFWAMNETTYTSLVALSLSINAAGAIVSGVNGEMPVIGGTIEVLDFIPDGVIIGGFGDLYLLAERAGTRIESSREAQFIQDNTVFKATARYDGRPVIGEGFVAINLNGATAPTANVTFATDTAN
nr:MAG TPA: major capsid protein [Caudoviricetes sp.]